MDAVFPALVSLVGVAVAGIALLGIVMPGSLARRLNDWRIVTGLPVTLALRVLFGSIFVIAAPDCRFPTFVRFVGFLEFTGAAVWLALGPARLGRFVDWWLERPPHFVRSWCLGAFALGIALFRAGT